MLYFFYMNRPDMEATNFNDITLAALDAPVRADILKEMGTEPKRKIVKNLVQSALIQGVRDPYEIRLWLGLPKYPLKTITLFRDEAIEEWKKNTLLDEDIALERSIQVKRAWENIRKCEEMYTDAKSVGDKVKVKQLELQFMQYLSKLNFLDNNMAGEGGNTFNIVAYAKQKEVESE